MSWRDNPNLVETFDACSVAVHKAARQRLPQRRPSVTETIAVRLAKGDVAEYQATVSFELMSCQPREIFLFGAKDGSDMAAALADTAVALSVALQHGVSAAAMARSVSRLPIEPDAPATEPASIVGAALDLLARHEAEAEFYQPMVDAAE